MISALILLPLLLVNSTPHDASFMTVMRCDSASMGNVADCNDVIYGVYPKNISGGDVIAYNNPWRITGSKADWIIHRVVSQHNATCWVTKGDNNTLDDRQMWGLYVCKKNIRAVVKWVRKQK